MGLIEYSAWQFALLVHDDLQAIYVIQIFRATAANQSIHQVLGPSNSL